MELLYLLPPQRGVRLSGIYVLDDDGHRAVAGPFTTEGDAVRWIEMTVPSRRALTRQSEAASRPG